MISLEDRLIVVIILYIHVHFLNTALHELTLATDDSAYQYFSLFLTFQAKLESKLAELYKHMMVVNQSLQMIVSPDKSLANHELPLAFYARLWGQVCKACRLLKESSGELLELSVLVPAAPWVSCM